MVIGIVGPRNVAALDFVCRPPPNWPVAGSPCQPGRRVGPTNNVRVPFDRGDRLKSLKPGLA
jgi:hypothetical protein